MRVLNLAIPCALALVLCGCYTVPVTGRSSMIMTSLSDEKALGITAYHEYCSNAVLLTDSTINTRVKNIGKKIAAVAEQDTPNIDWDWEFVVFDDSKTANAWCLPGGKVAVYSGLLPYAKTDAQLATVMAHEIGHAVARHGVERMGTENIVSAAGTLLGGMVSEANAATVQQAYGIGSNLLVTLPFSRKDEYEADKIGLNYMARAGYDPAEAINFWEGFSGAGASTLEFLSTHPSDANRIRALKEYLPEAQKLYKAK